MEKHSETFELIRRIYHFINAIPENDELHFNEEIKENFRFIKNALNKENIFNNMSLEELITLIELKEKKIKDAEEEVNEKMKKIKRCENIIKDSLAYQELTLGHSYKCYHYHTYGREQKVWYQPVHEHRQKKQLNIVLSEAAIIRYQELMMKNETQAEVMTPLISSYNNEESIKRKKYCKTQKISLRIYYADYAKVKELAKEKHIPVSWIIEDIIMSVKED